MFAHSQHLGGGCGVLGRETGRSNPVGRDHLNRSVRPGSSPLDRAIHRQEQISSNSCWQIVIKLDPYRHVAGGLNFGPQELRCSHRVNLRPQRIQNRGPVRVLERVVSTHRSIHRCLNLNVTTKRGGVQAAGKLLRVLNNGDLVVIRPWVRCGIGHSHRQVLAKIIGPCCTQARNGVLELLDTAGHGVGTGRGQRNDRLRAIGPV